MFKFRIAPRPGELVTQNNAREALIDIVDRKEKILYYEGEPRPEMKFISRAVDDDKNLRSSRCSARPTTSTCGSSSTNTPEQLAAGFPKTREELFAYRGLILGSIEAGAFTGDQLRMIGEFVERRGGGLLMLGGPRAFAEGGYAGTPVADALPVIIERPAAHAGRAARRAAAREADARRRGARRDADRRHRGGVDGAMERHAGAHERQHDPRREARRDGAAQRHRRTPAGSGRARVAALRPRQGDRVSGAGFVALADGREDEPSRTRRTRTTGASCCAGSWTACPNTVDVHTTTDRVEPGEPVTLVADVVDPAFVEVNDARVVAKVTGPKGAVDGRADAVDRRAQRRVPRDVPRRRPGHVRRAGRGDARRQVARHRHRRRCAPTPSDAEYFDADDARAALEADRRGNRRPVLHARDDRRRCRKISATPAAA